MGYYGLANAGSDFSRNFIQGFEAAKKSKLLDEELKLSQLQVEDYRIATAFREAQRNLTLQSGQAGIARDNAARDLDAFQLELAQALAPQQVSESKSRATKAKQDVTYARQDRPNQRRQLAADASFSESRAGQAQTDALRSALSLPISPGATPTNREPTEADAMGYAAMATSLLNIKDDSAKALVSNAYARKYMEENQGKRQQLIENELILKEKDVDNVAKMNATVAHAASLGPAYVEGLAGMLGKDHPIVAAARKTIEQGGVNETYRTMNPLDVAEGQQLAKELRELRQTLRQQQSRSDALETTNLGLFTSRENEKKRRTSKVEETKAEIADVESRLAELTGGRRSGTDVTAAIQSHLAQAGSGISPTATDEDLKKLAKYLNDQGIPATVEILRGMQKRSK